MGIMAITALILRVMLRWIYPFDLRPQTCRIRQVRVTPDTLRPASVYGQRFRIFGMLKGRTVTVLALDNTMLGCHVLLVLLIMALIAVFFGLIFYGEGLPLIQVARSVEAVHESTLTDNEIVGNYEGSRNQGKYQNTDEYVHWSPHMTFHFFSIFP